MKIVVDTNIVFSAILKSSSDIARLLLLGSDHFTFYSIDLLKSEISRHQTKLQKIGYLTQDQFNRSQSIIYSRINFYNQAMITDLSVNDATTLAKDVDINDALFVSLALHLDALLWTGDKKLVEGLKQKGFNKLVNTPELLEIWLQQR